MTIKSGEAIIKIGLDVDFEVVVEVGRLLSKLMIGMGERVLDLILR